MSFKSYLISRPFWKNILFSIVGIVAFLFLTMFVIRVYTNHGESFAVPNFKGMKQDQLTALSAEKGLNFEVIDSLHMQKAEPGTVVDQVPEAGALVKEGRTIFVTICAINPEQVKMPKLTDVSYRQALNVMQSSGLNVGDAIYVPSEYPDLVLNQMIDSVKIEKGTLVAKGSYIDLVIGELKSGEKTAAPNLIGVRLDQALDVIAESKLNKGAIIYDDSFTNLEDSLNARIWQQRPMSRVDELIDQGTSVDLWLTVDEDRLEQE